MDFARARHLMVETQVRTNDVTDVALLAALRRTPREAFVADALKPLAYSEAEIEVAPGRKLLRMRDLSKLLAALSAKPGEKALEIGGATGYGAALLAAMTGQAVTLDSDPQLTIAARAALAQAGAGQVTAASAPLEQGWPDGAPYDVIFAHGAVEVIPDAWLAQLAEGGRLAAIFRKGGASEARLYTKTDGVVGHRAVFDASAAVLPGLSAPKSFVF